MAHPPGSPSYHRRRSSSIFRIAQDPSHAPPRPPNGAAPGENSTGGGREGGRDSWDFDLTPESPDARQVFHAHGGGEDEEDDEDDPDEESGLTGHRRPERQHHHDVSPGAAAPEPLARAALLRGLAVNGALIALWYSFSISISVYNKWMFSAENLDFHFPLFTTAAHMVVQFLCASLVLWLFPRFRPGRADRDPGAAAEYTALGQPSPSSSSSSPSSSSRRASAPVSASSNKDGRPPLMTRHFYLTRVGPCGTATALDIGLGNFSLRFISLTFFTMCKSSVLAFVLLFAFAFGLERPTLRLCGVIAVMTAGVVMMVAGEAAFDPLGFVLVMTASLCSGFRWSLTQILLLRHPATRTPFSSIFFLTPVMFLALFVLAMVIEGPGALVEGWGRLAAERGAGYSFGIVLFPGLLAFLMVSAEFALIKRTSVVTLSVCGIFKEVLTISAASVAFGDPLSPINVSGLVVTIVSIAGYNWLKIGGARAKAREEAQQMLEMEDLSLRPGGEKIDRRGRGVGAGALMRPDHFVLDMDGDGHYDGRQVNGIVANGRANAFRKSPEHVE